MKEGNCGSFFPQRKALEALKNLLSLQCEVSLNPFNRFNKDWHNWNYKLFQELRRKCKIRGKKLLGGQ
jgi:hypothetical protein